MKWYNTLGVLIIGSLIIFTWAWIASIDFKAFLILAAYTFVALIGIRLMVKE